MEPISRERLAALLDVTTRTVKKRLTENMVEPLKADGRVDLYDSGIAIRAILLPEAVTGDALDLQQERAALAKAQREHYELPQRRDAGKLAPIDIVANAVDGEYTAVRGRLRSLPSALAPELAHVDERHAQTIVEKGIDDALHELQGAGIPRGVAGDTDGGAPKCSKPRA
jgi:phage terminase Nu1 subunit (DNA packaging protein)